MQISDTVIETYRQLKENNLIEVLDRTFAIRDQLQRGQVVIYCGVPQVQIDFCKGITMWIEAVNFNMEMRGSEHHVISWKNYKDDSLFWRVSGIFRKGISPIAHIIKLIQEIDALSDEEKGKLGAIHYNGMYKHFSDLSDL